ncbi:MAG: methylmalonyl Co-A mutase-associated GTPase MeaB [Acidobacteria bacterium]|nr:methylmalonyl Co-A mutase-associated GTPase MeaB [Acidobacteriota bacterium]
MDLADRVLAGDQRAIARAISLVENEPDAAAGLLRHMAGRIGHARVIGVTGAPGVGKSTLVDGLAAEYRRMGRTVGILAIDPTSPISGGAILGDRVRMQRHVFDEGVYVRSMATHGRLGGLSHATSDAVLILDAAGREVVLVETAGVGQAEVDIAPTADASIVVTIPDARDGVQAMKAAIMDIGDVFVVNKLDRPGAERAAAEIEEMLSLREYGEVAWRPPVLKTRAATGEGVAAVVEAVERFTGQPADTRERRRTRARTRLTDLLRQQFIERLERREETRKLLDEAVERLAAGEIDPYAAAAEIMERTS